MVRKRDVNAECCGYMRKEIQLQRDRVRILRYLYCVWAAMGCVSGVGTWPFRLP